MSVQWLSEISKSIRSSCLVVASELHLRVRLPTGSSGYSVGAATASGCRLPWLPVELAADVVFLADWRLFFFLNKSRTNPIKLERRATRRRDKRTLERNSERENELLDHHNQHDRLQQLHQTITSFDVDRHSTTSVVKAPCRVRSDDTIVASATPP